QTKARRAWFIHTDRKKKGPLPRVAPHRAEDVWLKGQNKIYAYGPCTLRQTILKRSDQPSRNGHLPEQTHTGEDTGQKFTKFFKIEFMYMIGIMIIRRVRAHGLVGSRDEQHAPRGQQPLKFADDLLLPPLIDMLNPLKAGDNIKAAVWKSEGCRHVPP